MIEKNPVWASSPRAVIPISIGLAFGAGALAMKLLLPASQAAVPPISAPAVAGSRVVTPRTSSAERRTDLAAESYQTRHERAIANHHVESIREPWAMETAQSLRSDLQQIKDGHFRLVEVDCRSDTCLAKLEWPSHELAMQHWGAVLHHSYRAAGSVRVFLDESIAHLSPYPSTVVFTFHHARSAASSTGATP